MRLVSEQQTDAEEHDATGPSSSQQQTPQVNDHRHRQTSRKECDQPGWRVDIGRHPLLPQVGGQLRVNVVQEEMHTGELSLQCLDTFCRKCHWCHGPDEAFKQQQ